MQRFKLPLGVHSFPLPQGLLPTRDHGFWDENLLGHKRWIFVCVIYFHFGWYFKFKIVFRGFRDYRIQRLLLICSPHSQPQKMPSNSTARAASAVGKRGLWRPCQERRNTSTSHSSSRIKNSLLARSRLSSYLSTSLQHQRQQCIFLMYLFRY